MRVVLATLPKEEEEKYKIKTPYLKLHLGLSLGGHAGSAGEMEACELTEASWFKAPPEGAGRRFRLPNRLPGRVLRAPVSGRRRVGRATVRAAAPLPVRGPGPRMGQEEPPGRPARGGSAR